jgi:hypothetical protein
MISEECCSKGCRLRRDFVKENENENKEHLERITQRVNRLLEEAQSSRKVPNVVINAHINIDIRFCF